MTSDLKGGCLCGAVKYCVSVEPEVVGHCYCEDCRRTSGTTHGTHVGVPTHAVALSGNLSSFDKPADSSNVVSRHFCGTCGSAIFSTNSAMDGMTFLRASSLDDPNLVRPQVTVYASRAPEWALIDRSGPVFEGMPTDIPGAPPAPHD